MTLESRPSDQRTDHQPRKRPSVERTLTWAEEVERQRIRAQRRTDKRRAERERILRLAERGQGPLGDDTGSVSAHVIDSLVDAMNPEDRYKTPLPTASSVISRLARRRQMSTSSSEDELVSRSLSSRTTTRSLRRPKTASPTASSITSTGPLTPTSTSTHVLSIDEIVKRHSPAMKGAVDGVKEKARRDMGLTTPGSRISAHLPSPPASSSPKKSPSNALHTPPSAGSRHAQEHSLPPTPVTPSPGIDQLAPSPAHTRPSSASHSAPARPPPPKSQNRLPHHALPPYTPSPDTDSDSDSLGSDLMASQAFLDRIDTTSTTSRPSRLSSTPSPSLRTSSPFAGSFRSKHMSLPASFIEQDTHNLAKYLRSPRLNRYILLDRPSSQRPLHVSLADIGAPNGKPLVVFLGLGCVRHLIAMFDDLAAALNLRMICIDRWGYGKTDNVPQDKRTPLAWADVVVGVLDKLGVKDVSILAHSAGAPYAAATALKLGERVKGKIHFAAPWVSAEIDGGYRWLKWVPSGVIKGAFAAEWKLQSYRLGRPPPLYHQAVSHVVGEIDHMYPRSSEYPSTVYPGSKKRYRKGIVRQASQILGGKFEQPSTSTLRTTESSGGKLSTRTTELPPRTRSHTAIPKRSSTANMTMLFRPVIEFRSVSASTTSVEEAQESFDYDFFSQQLARALPPSDGSDRPPVDSLLLRALEQASHAECEPGTTDDLMSIILNRAAMPWGFSYADLGRPSVIWWGDEDERISEKSVRWMERSMGAELRIVPAGDHNLMRNTEVICEILEDVSERARDRSVDSGP